MLQRILCVLGLHRWGEAFDVAQAIPSEDDCARIMFVREWPIDRYQRCTACDARRHLAKIYQRNP